MQIFGAAADGAEIPSRSMADKYTQDGVGSAGFHRSHACGPGLGAHELLTQGAPLAVLSQAQSDADNKIVFGWGRPCETGAWNKTTTSSWRGQAPTALTAAPFATTSSAPVDNVDLLSSSGRCATAPLHAPLGPVPPSASCRLLNAGPGAAAGTSATAMDTSADPMASELDRLSCGDFEPTALDLAARGLVAHLPMPPMAPGCRARRVHQVVGHTSSSGGCSTAAGESVVQPAMDDSPWPAPSPSAPKTRRMAFAMYGSQLPEGTPLDAVAALAEEAGFLGPQGAGTKPPSFMNGRPGPAAGDASTATGGILTCSPFTASAAISHQQMTGTSASGRPGGAALLAPEASTCVPPHGAPVTILDRQGPSQGPLQLRDTSGSPDDMDVHMGVPMECSGAVSHALLPANASGAGGGTQQQQLGRTGERLSQSGGADQKEAAAATRATSAPAAGLSPMLECRTDDDGPGGAVESSAAAANSSPVLKPSAGRGALPPPVTVQVYSRSKRKSEGSGKGGKGGRSRVTRGAVGVFYPQLYLTGGDCIECGAEIMSRGRFERLAGTATAKWHVSIKVLPSGMTLGRWLQHHGLPILQGRPRKRRADTDEEDSDDAEDMDPSRSQPAPHSQPMGPDDSLGPPARARQAGVDTPGAAPPPTSRLASVSTAALARGRASQSRGQDSESPPRASDPGGARVAASRQGDNRDGGAAASGKLAATVAPNEDPFVSLLSSSGVLDDMAAAFDGPPSRVLGPGGGSRSQPHVVLPQVAELGSPCRPNPFAVHSSLGGSCGGLSQVRALSQLSQLPGGGFSGLNCAGSVGPGAMPVAMALDSDTAADAGGGLLRPAGDSLPGDGRLTGMSASGGTTSLMPPPPPQQQQQQGTLPGDLNTTLFSTRLSGTTNSSTHWMGSTTSSSSVPTLGGSTLSVSRGPVFGGGLGGSGGPLTYQAAISAASLLDARGSNPGTIAAGGGLMGGALWPTRQAGVHASSGEPSSAALPGQEPGIRDVLAGSGSSCGVRAGRPPGTRLLTSASDLFNEVADRRNLARSSGQLLDLPGTHSMLSRAQLRTQSAAADMSALAGANAGGILAGGGRAADRAVNITWPSPMEARAAGLPPELRGGGVAAPANGTSPAAAARLTHSRKLLAEAALGCGAGGGSAVGTAAMPYQGHGRVGLHGWAQAHGSQLFSAPATQHEQWTGDAAEERQHQVLQPPAHEPQLQQGLAQPGEVWFQEQQRQDQRMHQQQLSALFKGAEGHKGSVQLPSRLLNVYAGVEGYGGGGERSLGSRMLGGSGAPVGAQGAALQQALQSGQGWAEQQILLLQQELSGGFGMGL